MTDQQKLDTPQTNKHFHVWVSAWRDGKPPKAMFNRGGFTHRTQANRRKAQITADPRDLAVVLACDNPDCKIHGKG